MSTPHPISVSQAAEIIGCSPRHVRDLVSAGKISGEKIGQRCWILKKTSVDKYAKTQQKLGRPRNSKNISR